MLVIQICIWINKSLIGTEQNFHEQRRSFSWFLNQHLQNYKLSQHGFEISKLWIYRFGIHLIQNKTVNLIKTFPLQKRYSFSQISIRESIRVYVVEYIIRQIQRNQKMKNEKNHKHYISNPRPKVMIPSKVCTRTTYVKLEFKTDFVW